MAVPYEDRGETLSPTVDCHSNNDVDDNLDKNKRRSSSP